MRRCFSRTMSLLACAACVALACSFFARDDERLRTDFRTEGFIYPDVYQSVVRAAPDAGCRGLVDCRANAYAKAELILVDTVTRNLVRYCVERRLGGTGAPVKEPVEKNLYESLAGFARQGERAFEYYEKDHSAVIVYRIRRSRLQKRIESLEVSPVGAEKEKEDKK